MWSAPRLRRGVKRVIALSTDKAANPINLYGASKLASDKIFVAANNLAGADGTRFSVVRYGNVFGSRGSVVPFFQKLVGGGRRQPADHRCAHDPLLDHADPGRQFRALQHGDDARRRDLRAQDSLDHHSRSWRRLVSPDLKQHVVGIRPGEKLHEIMIPADDAHCTVELDDRYVILQSFANAARDAYLHRGGKPVRGRLQLFQRHQSGKAGRARPADPAADGLCLTATVRTTAPAFLPYGRQEIGDADIKAVVEALVLRLADHRSACCANSNRPLPPIAARAKALRSIPAPRRCIAPCARSACRAGRRSDRAGHHLRRLRQCGAL